MQWTGVKVAVLPCLALGDTTLYLRLAWHFSKAGAQVTLFSTPFVSMQKHIAGVAIAESAGLELQGLVEQFDLLVIDTAWLYLGLTPQQEMFSASKIAFTCAKKLPKALGLEAREVIVNGHSLGHINAPLRKRRSDDHMVAWIDRYAEQAFGLNVTHGDALLTGLSAPSSQQAKRVAIFPTTPMQAKNYSLAGFKFVARTLQRQGWEVEFVCTPSEQDGLRADLQKWPLQAFGTIGELARYLGGCAVVISNDSGGGHLGSLLGLATFTVTRRAQTFAWRPGFNRFNQVISPLFTFKFMGKPVWRPFIPIWRIAQSLGSPPGKFGA